MNITLESVSVEIFTNLTDGDLVQLLNPARIRNYEASVKWKDEFKWDGASNANWPNNGTASVRGPSNDFFRFHFLLIVCMLLLNISLCIIGTYNQELGKEMQLVRKRLEISAVDEAIDESSEEQAV